MSERPARVDGELVRRGLARSRAQAQQLVRQGAVLVAGIPVAKPSAPVGADAPLTLAAVPDAWVGRGAYKLLAALRCFPIPVAGRRCLDVGASTGGFTQVLLEAGASAVVALDVGHGQLAAAVGDDPRVEERSGRNIRDVAAGDLGPPFDLVVADLSFISLRTVLPQLADQLDAAGDAVVLVKPQFEVGRERLGRGGVVKAAEEHARVLREVLHDAKEAGMRAAGVVPSPVLGTTGNQEYLVWLKAGPVGERCDPAPGADMVQEAVQAARDAAKGPR